MQFISSDHNKKQFYYSKIFVIYQLFSIRKELLLFPVLNYIYG